MKTIWKNRVLAALVVAILAVGPTAAALPRDHSDRGFPAKISRLIQKVQHIFRAVTTGDPVIPIP